MRASDDPWKLWGGSQELTALSPAAGLPAVESSNQIAKVNYGRPDTWHWWFGAQLLSAPEMPAVGNVASVRVRFDITIGVGRSTYTTGSQVIGSVQNSFETLGWSWQGGPTPAPVEATIWSTEVFGPARINDPTVLTPPENRVRQIVAESIQCRARVTFTASNGGGQQAKVLVTAFFAPVHHARPEWFLEQFPGGENKGK